MFDGSLFLRIKKFPLCLFLTALFHPTMESSPANLIFSPYTETTDKLNDSASLSIISQSAESSESNVARYLLVHAFCVIYKKFYWYLKFTY